MCSTDPARRAGPSGRGTRVCQRPGTAARPARHTHWCTGNPRRQVCLGQEAWRRADARVQLWHAHWYAGLHFCPWSSGCVRCLMLPTPVAMHCLCPVPSTQLPAALTFNRRYSVLLQVEHWRTWRRQTAPTSLISWWVFFGGRDVIEHCVW